MGGLIGNHANTFSRNACKAYNDIFSKLFVYYEKCGFIHDAVNHIVHVVRLLGISGDDFVQSGLIQRLYKQSHKDTEALEQILSTIVGALREHRDAETQAVFLCEECGQVKIGEKPRTCPSCTSDRIRGF